MESDYISVAIHSLFVDSALLFRNPSLAELILAILISLRSLGGRTIFDRLNQESECFVGLIKPVSESGA